LGLANIKIGLSEKAETYFDKLVQLESDISKMTIAKDFIRPIGELYAEREANTKSIILV
jgi:hypothetical protein